MEILATRNQFKNQLQRLTINLNENHLNRLTESLQLKNLNTAQVKVTFT
jgi:hypothetical protein